MSQPLDLKPALVFLDDLRAHNHKTWFEQHRAEYEAARGAFEQLVDGLIDEFRAADQLHDLAARACLARIYRDVRFAKDKSPYKTNLGALVAPGGWKSGAFGYYVALEPRGQSLVAGGLYGPTPQQLDRFRRAVAADAAPLKKLMRARAFVEHFGALQGERLKTAPKGYDREHPEIALLQLKQITVIQRFSDAAVTAPDFPRQAAAACRAMRSFLDYLGEALG